MRATLARACYYADLDACCRHDDVAAIMRHDAMPTYAAMLRRCFHKRLSLYFAVRHMLLTLSLLDDYC